MKKTEFKRKVLYWARRIKVVPRQIRLQKMRGKWASCSTRGWVSFNTLLLERREDFQRYAIIHELLHIQIPNHGKLFKTMMTVYLPLWREIEKKYHLK